MRRQYRLPGSRPVSAPQTASEEGKEGAKKAKEQQHSFSARRGLTDIKSCLVRMIGENPDRGKLCLINIHDKK